MQDLGCYDASVRLKHQVGAHPHPLGVGSNLPPAPHRRAIAPRVGYGL